MHCETLAIDVERNIGYCSCGLNNYFHPHKEMITVDAKIVGLKSITDRSVQADGIPEPRATIGT